MPVEPVTASIYIDAPPISVFEYFTRPQAIVRWMGDSALLEPHPGGRFVLDVPGAQVRGHYLTLEPPHRIVLSWGYAGSTRLPPGASTVEIRLIPDGVGTRVELEHRDLPDGQAQPHLVGWEHYLPRLRAAATGRDPGADPGMPDVSGQLRGQ